MAIDSIVRMRRTCLWSALALMAAAAVIGGRLAAQDAASPEGAAAQAPGETAEEPSPPGEILFVGKNKIATANSRFHQWKITSLTLDRENLAESSVEIEVDVASLDTGIKRRDDHLRSADFFDVAKWPTSKIRIYEVRPKEGGEAGRYTAKMDLTIRDVTKTQEIEFEIVDVETMKVSGKVTILRTDYGVGEPHKALNPMSVENEVNVSFEATLDAKR